MLIEKVKQLLSEYSGDDIIECVEHLEDASVCLDDVRYAFAKARYYEKQASTNPGFDIRKEYAYNRAYNKLVNFIRSEYGVDVNNPSVDFKVETDLDYDDGRVAGVIRCSFTTREPEETDNGLMVKYDDTRVLDVYNTRRDIWREKML